MLSIGIESVIAQEFDNWELIIIDDGSTDKTKELVQEFMNKDPRVKYIYQENAERSAARNNGIKYAYGKYICFLDSDDYYLPNRLSLLRNFILNDKETSGFYYTGISFLNGKEVTERPEREQSNENVFEFITKAIIGTPQVVLTKEIAQTFNFNPDFEIGEDMELWLRISKKSKPVFIPNQATIIARDHEDRSVNLNKYNNGAKLIKLYKFIFEPFHSGNVIRKSFKKELKSDAYFTIARHYMLNKKTWFALKNLLLSILQKPIHPQSKHKIYCFINLLVGKVPREYN